MCRVTANPSVVLLIFIVGVSLHSTGCRKSSRRNDDEQGNASPTEKVKRGTTSSPSSDFLRGDWSGKSPDGESTIKFSFAEDGQVTWNVQSDKHGTGMLRAQYEIDERSRPVRLKLFKFQDVPYKQSQFLAIIEKVSESRIRLEGVMLEETDDRKRDYPKSFSSAAAILTLHR